MKNLHSKMISDEEMIQRRLALEAESYGSQIQAVRQSLAASQQAYNDLQLKTQRQESDLRVQVRELQGKIVESEDFSNTMKQLAVERGNCVAKLEQENQTLQQSLTSDRSQALSQKDQFILREVQLNTEIQLLQGQLIELQTRHEETVLLLEQKKDRIRDSEENVITQQKMHAKQMKECTQRCLTAESLQQRLNTELEDIKKEVSLSIVTVW
jgi:hypothetical protein